MKFPTLIVFFLFLIAYFINSTLYVNPVSAQNCTTDTRVTSGLITTPSVTGKFGVDSTGKCIASNQTSFAPFKIPSYEDLKSLYYTQAKTSASIHKDSSTAASTTLNSSNNSSFASNNSYLEYYQGNLTIDSNFALTGNPVVVFFIDGTLSINDNLSIANDAALVFVVSGNGNVSIAQSVTQIDAVIIASGTIYTAGANCQSSNVPASTLTINGSLVSLNSASPPVFCRTLGSGNSANPAEKVIQQPKYLVILRDLFSDTLQKWSEIQ